MQGNGEDIEIFSDDYILLSNYPPMRGQGLPCQILYLESTAPQLGYEQHWNCYVSEISLHKPEQKVCHPLDFAAPVLYLLPAKRKILIIGTLHPAYLSTHQRQTDTNDEFNDFFEITPAQKTKKTLAIHSEKSQPINSHTLNAGAPSLKS